MVDVMIVGCVRLYCEGLAATLRSNGGVSVVAAVSAHNITVDDVKKHAPDVVVVDVQSDDLLHFVRALRREVPAIKLVAFATEGNENSVVRCAEAGVSGYVTCDASVEELVEVLRKVVREECVCPPRVAAMLLRRLASPGTSQKRSIDEAVLTARERQVLRHICDGLSNKEIAQLCHISEATVKTHVHHLLEKLKVNTRNEAAARATSTTARRDADASFTRTP